MAEKKEKKPSEGETMIFYRWLPWSMSRSMSRSLAKFVLSSHMHVGRLGKGKTRKGKELLGSGESHHLLILNGLGLWITVAETATFQIDCRGMAG